MPSSPVACPLRPLRELIAAPDYFARVSEVVLRIETTSDPACLVELLREATHLVGADVAAFMSFIDDGECEAFRYLLACDPQWCVEYERCAWYADDPWLAYARRHSLPIRASEVVSSGPTQAELVRLAEHYGFRSTAILPAPSSGGLSRLGMLCLGSNSPGFFETPGFGAVTVVARPLAAALLEGSIRSTRDELVHAWRIKPKELALLDLQRRGMSTKQIAATLGVSPHSVNSYFQRVNAKLGVLNRKEAAHLAAEYGLI